MDIILEGMKDRKVDESWAGNTGARLFKFLRKSKENQPKSPKMLYCPKNLNIFLYFLPNSCNCPKKPNKPNIFEPASQAGHNLKILGLLGLLGQLQEFERKYRKILRFLGQYSILGDFG